MACVGDGEQSQSHFPAYAYGLHFSNRPSYKVLGSDGQAGDSASMPQLPLARTSCSRLPVGRSAYKKNCNPPAIMPGNGFDYTRLPDASDGVRGEGIPLARALLVPPCWDLWLVKFRFG